MDNKNAALIAETSARIAAEAKCKALTEALRSKCIAWGGGPRMGQRPLVYLECEICNARWDADPLGEETHKDDCVLAGTKV